MFMSIVSHLLCSWFAFLLPSYSTFKALSRGPSSTSGELESLAMYWAVIGAFVAVEQTVGSLMSWLPFYWEIRTIFLLYISLPQIQGSTYVYKVYFQPFCIKNEADLDAGIASAQRNLMAFCRAHISRLIDIIWNILNKTPITKQPRPDGESAAPGGGYSLDQIKGLWNAYSPTVFAAFSAGSITSSKESGWTTGTTVNNNGPHERSSTEPTGLES
ncbi:TB2/DP1, HVA22 family-domain-containing protein [Phlebopus sp. FC_14]|nr:TB2/DP1, HVA22 family-domain-containing protein [Phlebopus sp. FC_14]